MSGFPFEKLPSEGDCWLTPPATCAELRQEMDRAAERFREKKIAAGTRIHLPMRPDLACFARLFALWRLGAIVTFEPLQRLLDTDSPPRLLRDFAASGQPGLILTTAGSTARPKAVLHNATRLLSRYATPGASRRTLLFFPPHHIGGLHTALYTLFAGGSLAAPRSLRPEDVLRCVEQHAVETLPVSPSFLRLALAGGAFDQFDLSSLKTVSFGSEPAGESLIAQVRRRLPRCRVVQTYGSTEAGILRVRGCDEGGGLAWRPDQGGDQVRIRDGHLEVRTETSMLGYLNADGEDPFTDDGWLKTGDRVEKCGEGYRILGRESEMINVGGYKVAPAEVEAVAEQCPGVLAATAYAAPHPLLGNVVGLRIVRSEFRDSSLGPRAGRQARNEGAEDEEDQLVPHVREFCWRRLPNHAAPVTIEVQRQEISEREFKKRRCGGRRAGSAPC